MDNLLSWVQGTGPSPFAGIFGEGLATRSNTPSGAYDQIFHADMPGPGQPDRLWTVDRILEVQTIPHFINFAVSGELLSGKRTAMPVLAEVEYIQVPLTEWAPAPYSKHEMSMIESLMRSIGSEEDSSRMIPISKELLAMKTRVWEGFVPLSERRWTELDLDSPERFHEACQFIAAVTDVFHYLNIPEIKASLRQTYNLIWGHLDTFDKALHALGLESTDPDFSMTALWHEYITDHFETISSISHSWTIDHIERLRAPIMEILAADKDIGALETDDTYGDTLANLIHDLHENAAQADSGIFLPTDGFRGSGLSSQDDVPGNQSYRYRPDPIAFSASTEKRKADYYFRVRYLSHQSMFTMENILDNSVYMNAKEQMDAEVQARKELRGEERYAGPPLWVLQARRYLEHQDSLPWAYMGFRTCFEHTDEEWELFKTRFAEDVADWGRELGDVDDIRAISVVEWQDADGELDMAGADKQFTTLRQEKEDKDRFNEWVFLVADKAVIDSYLHPAAPNTPGHILAVEAAFDPAELERPDETPGYAGWLRLQSSLLWDDVSAQMLMQSEFLTDLWPLAKDDPEQIYRHPLGPVSGHTSFPGR